MVGPRPTTAQLTDIGLYHLHAAFTAAGLDQPSARGLNGHRHRQAQRFLRPAFETFGKPEDMVGRFLEGIARNLRGDLGRV